MAKKLLDKKMQQVYFVALRCLHIISIHPRLVEQGALDYFMVLENIKEKVKSFDPIEWYVDQKYEKESLSFNDLPMEDRIKLKSVLDDLTSPSVSQNHLERKCFACGWLADDFGKKILARQETTVEEAIT